MNPNPPNTRDAELWDTSLKKELRKILGIKPGFSTERMGKIEELVAAHDRTLIKTILAEDVPGYWLVDPKYRNLEANPDNITDYFEALGHDKTIAQITTALQKRLEQ